MWCYKENSIWHDLFHLSYLVMLDLIVWNHSYCISRICLYVVLLRCILIGYQVCCTEQCSAHVCLKILCYVGISVVLYCVCVTSGVACVWGVTVCAVCAMSYCVVQCCVHVCVLLCLCVRLMSVYVCDICVGVLVCGILVCCVCVCGTCGGVVQTRPPLLPRRGPEWSTWCIGDAEMDMVRLVKVRKERKKGGREGEGQEVESRKG